MARHSVSLYVCAAFLAVFGVIGLNGVDPDGAKVELLLAVVVAGAGVFLHSGAEQGRVVGMGVLAVVIAYGFYRLTQGSYVPGTIVAGIALVRLATAGSTTVAASPGHPQGYQPGYPQPQPYGYPVAGQPQQMYYGQQPLGQPAPYGAPVQYSAPPPPAPPQVQPVAQPQTAPWQPSQQPPEQPYDPYRPPPGR